MSALAKAHKAINLGQGFPEFDPPKALIDSVYEYLKKGLNQYAPSIGLLSLREAIASKLEVFNKTRFDPEQEITVTSGATEALFDAILAFCTQGDEVLIIEPAYDSYTPAVLMAGARPVYYRLPEPDFHFDALEFRKLISPKTKAILLNNPMNPCGKVWTKSDLDQIEQIVLEYNLLLICDEVYEHIYFEQAFISMLTYPRLKGHVISVSSFGKTFNNTGWKLGYAVADAALMAEFRKVHQFVTFSSFTAAQAALADQLADHSWYDSLRSMYLSKRNVLTEAFRTHARELKPSEGTYFQLLRMPSNALGDLEFAEKLVKEAGVAVIPLSPFYHDAYDPKLLRLCFAKSDDTLKEGARRLCQTLG
jgi:methionine aminotransferase